MGAGIGLSASLWWIQPYIAGLIAAGEVLSASELAVLAFLNNGKNVIYLGSSLLTAGLSSIFGKAFSKFMKAIKNAK